MQVTKDASMEIYPGFETQDRIHQKSETEESVALEKTYVPQNLKKNFHCDCSRNTKRVLFYLDTSMYLQQFFFSVQFFNKMLSGVKRIK